MHLHPCILFRALCACANSPFSKYQIFSLIVRQWGQNSRNALEWMCNWNICMSSTFRCLCPLNLFSKLNFNISKRPIHNRCRYKRYKSFIVKFIEGKRSEWILKISIRGNVRWIRIPFTYKNVLNCWINKELIKTSFKGDGTICGA